MPRPDSLNPPYPGVPASFDGRGLGLVIAGHAAVLAALVALRPAIERPPPPRPIFADIVLPGVAPDAVPQAPVTPPPTPATDEPPPRPAPHHEPEPVAHVTAAASPPTAPTATEAAPEASVQPEASIPSTEEPAPVAAPRPAAMQAPLETDELRRYVTALMRQLNRYKTYPRELKKAKVEGTVVLEFTIDADGRLLVSAVQRSSGHADLDRAAMDMLARANPLPAIPDSLDRDELALAIPVEYSLITDR